MNTLLPLTQGRELKLRKWVMGKVVHPVAPHAGA